jgi:hypothetical protein
MGELIATTDRFDTWRLSLVDVPPELSSCVMYNGYTMTLTGWLQLLASPHETIAIAFPLYQKSAIALRRT